MRHYCSCGRSAAADLSAWCFLQVEQRRREPGDRPHSPFRTDSRGKAAVPLPLFHEAPLITIAQVYVTRFLIKHSIDDKMIAVSATSPSHGRLVH